MAMQSGNAAAAVVEKPHRGEAAGVQHSSRGYGGQWWPQQQQQIIDEREGFLLWLRGEFAAANAMIDALCHHLRAVGEFGEYDGVIGCIQQRRCNWNSVLHMQQYFSVVEVIYALQQVGWRRQQRPHEGYGKPVKEFRRGGGRGQRGGGETSFKDNGSGGESAAAYTSKDMNENVDEKIGEEKKVNFGAESVPGPPIDSSVNSSGMNDGCIPTDPECIPEAVDTKCTSNSKGVCDSENGEVSHEKQEVTPKTFFATELIDGRMVNVVDGLKLYEDLIEGAEVSKLVALVNDLRAAGKRRQLQGQTFVISKRPMKGHGREIIQLGVPIVDVPMEDEAGAAGTSKDRKVEPIPGLLQEVIECCTAKKIIGVKPDSCIIDIFNEVDHSQPFTWPHSFGRPVSVLFLTECDMTFGRVFGSDHPGEYRGSFKVSLTPGSMLVAQGRSADISKHALPSQRKQRILVTLVKSQPKRITTGDVSRFPSSGASPTSHWPPPPSRSPNHIRHPAGHKHYGPLPTAGVLPAPSGRPQLAPANGIQPIFVPAQVAPAMTFPAPVALAPASAWPAAPSRHPPPSLPVPGTGVFLPPGSGTLNVPSVSVHAADDSSTATTGSSGSAKVNGRASSSSSSPNSRDGEKVQQEDCSNGSLNGTDQEKTSEAKEEEHKILDTQPPPAGSV